MASEDYGDLLPEDRAPGPAPEGAPLRVVRFRWHLGVVCMGCETWVGEAYKRWTRDVYHPCGHLISSGPTGYVPWEEVRGWAMGHLHPLSS